MIDVHNIRRINIIQIKVINPHIRDLLNMPDDVHKFNAILVYLNYSPYYIFDFNHEHMADQLRENGYVKALDWLYDSQHKSENASKYKFEGTFYTFNGMYL